MLKYSKNQMHKERKIGSHTTEVKMCDHESRQVSVLEFCKSGATQNLQPAQTGVEQSEATRDCYAHTFVGPGLSGPEHPVFNTV